MQVSNLQLSLRFQVYSGQKCPGMEHRKLYCGSRDSGNPHCQPSAARPNSPLADKHHRVRTESCNTCSLSDRTKAFAHCSATQHLHWSSGCKAHQIVCLVISKEWSILCHNDTACSAKLWIARFCSMPRVHDLDSTDDVHCLWHTMDRFSIFMHLQTHHTMSVDTRYL